MADAGDGLTTKYTTLYTSLTNENLSLSYPRHVIVHKFWESQPVLQFQDVEEPITEGPIVPRLPVSAVKQEPFNLLSRFEWRDIDISDDASFAELRSFLEQNYGSEGSICFTFSKIYLRWVLGAPGCIKSLHVGVFAKNTNMLVGFISGVPTYMHLKGERLSVAVVNILCVHKKLRFKRLAPVLIKELARRAQLKDIWQGFCATNYIFPTPFSTSCWMDRPIKVRKLVDIGLVAMDQTMTEDQLSNIYKLPKATATRGFRRMIPSDVTAVSLLLQKHLRGFLVTPEVNDRFVKHFLLPKKGLVYSYVVENPETNAITDFCSFFCRKAPIPNNPKHSKLRSAILFYYASSKTPLERLMKDLLVMAKKIRCDHFRAHGIMGNNSFLDELLFTPNQKEWKVNYYFYNYRLKDALTPRALGFVVI